MKKISIIFLLTNLVLFNQVVFAKTDTDSLEALERTTEIEKAFFRAAAGQEKILKIGLADCLVYALKNNSEILIKRIEPKLKDEDIKIAKADFEPTFSVDYTLHKNTKPSANALSGAAVSSYRDTDFNAGVSGKLITGTEYEAEFINEKYKSNSSYQSINPYYATEPKITITQPLFRDFGVLVNTAEISIAKNNKLDSQEGFKAEVMDIISNTKIAYYNYIFYLENYAIAQSSLARAKDLLEINNARYEKGLLSSVDLLETESTTAQRQKSLIESEANLRKAEDDLKLVTNLVDEPELWNAKLEIIDKNPEFQKEDIELVESIKNSFLYRPEYLQAKLDLKNKNINIVTAKNALLPTIDLVTSFGLNGLGSDFTNSIEKIDSDYKDWSIGFKVSVPWGGAERAGFDQKKLEKAKALLSFKRLEQNIILEIRDNVRQVELQLRQIEAAKLSKETQEKNYTAQEERYANGQVSTHDILDYQEELAQAELDYAKAVIDYNISLINLDKSQGLTLAKNNIKLEE